MNVVKQLELAISAGPTMVTLLFVTIFLGTLVWIYRPGSKRHYDHQANLPLEDGLPHEDRATGAQHPLNPERRPSEKRNG